MSGDASWWSSVVDRVPARGDEVLGLSEEGSVCVTRYPGDGRDWWANDDRGRVIAWAHIPHHDFHALWSKYCEAKGL